jgi:hypothetical protein
MKKKFELEKIFDFLLDNVFDLITILVAAFFVTRYTISTPKSEDVPILITWVLAVLGLIAVSGLWERNRRLSRIEQITKRNNLLVERHLAGLHLAKDFFRHQFEPVDFSNADTIFISGILLSRSLSLERDSINERFKSGANVRIMILDPQKADILNEFSLWSNIENTDAEFWRIRLGQNIKVIENMASAGNVLGKLEIGYLPFIPSFGLTFINPLDNHGIGYVRIYHHKLAVPEPTFKLSKMDDAEWFEFFLNQYEILWASCRTVTLNQKKTLASKKIPGVTK